MTGQGPQQRKIIPRRVSGVSGSCPFDVDSGGAGEAVEAVRPSLTSRDEVEWAAARTDCDEHLLAQLLTLKSYQRMACLPKLDEIPETVVDFDRRAVDLPEGTMPRAANRTAERQRTAVRQRTGLSYDKAKARKIAEAVMRSEAVSKNRPADLINIALEKVVEAGLELPVRSGVSRSPGCCCH
ncbi:DUF4158 domain-containing protein [Streptomyces sp. RY43-2]|uniref:DUF4158 domain-containing protein n=1 Tax=Streptomyces macrolidinus TaxID=2952607 RepID=A0ABT0ZE58_9ACTN|nr:DUF4158 domain-containing protein [Streptomyces macrolidinus]MCN9241868.1 DUF4158 domain-containing protein [Streptomyces macrolidinus]